jgi:hypothetical protein
LKKLDFVLKINVSFSTIFLFRQTFYAQKANYKTTFQYVTHQRDKKIWAKKILPQLVSKLDIGKNIVN